MNTEQVFRDALRARAATAEANPNALAELRRRTARRRWVNRVQVATAAATVTALVVGTSLALDDDRDPRPPVATDPTATPTASPTTSPSPSPSASATTGAAVGRDEFVAVLTDGRLVVASASTGRVVRTVLPHVGDRPGRLDAFGPESLVLAPDRRSVFLARTGAGAPCPDEGVVERVDLGTGARTRIGYGRRPDVSPDGDRLVYVTGCAAAVVVHDLRTGVERRYPHIETEYDADGNPMPWSLDRAVWQGGGTRLWVVVMWENETELRELDPVTDRTTGDAAAVRTTRSTFGLDRQGDTLVYQHSCCYIDEEPGEDAIVLRDPKGEETDLVRAPRAHRLGAPTAGPDGDVLYERGGRLYRLDRTTRESTDLGTATALARDW